MSSSVSVIRPKNETAPSRSCTTRADINQGELIGSSAGFEAASKKVGVVAPVDSAGPRASHSRGILQAGDLKMDLDRHSLWKVNEEIHLTPKEFDLLSYLFENQGALVTHMKLLHRVWGPEYRNEIEYLRTYIHTLRKKIEDDPARPRYIVTEPWAGYRLRDPSDLRGHSLSESVASPNWLSRSIVHDLRNPVATIYTSAEALMNPDTASTGVKRLAANMYHAASRMRDLLAEVGRAIFGEVSTAEICEMREVIVAASDAASAAAENRSAEVLLDVPRGLELPLARSRIEGVFFNLITNALEAMSGGGEIRIRARQDRNNVVVEIEDTGPGIPHQIRDRVFEPYVTAGKANGLGLGLALSRRAVRDHGGDMWIEAATGARFVMSFPLKRTSPMVAGDASGPVGVTPSVPHPPKLSRILKTSVHTGPRTENEVGHRTVEHQNPGHTKA